MTVEVEAGAFLDLGSKVSRMHDKMFARKPLPIRGKIIAGSNTGTAPLTVEVQTADCPPGRIWNLLFYGLWATDGHTALANAIADIYIAGSGVQLPDFSCQIDFGRAVPSIATLSEDVHWIQPGEKLIAVVYGFAASQTISLVGRVADFPNEGMEAMTL